MALKIKFHPDAEKELRTSFLYYFDRSRIVAASFQLEAEHAIDAISRNPGRWPVLVSDLRRYIFPRFPFSLIYRNSEDGIEVIAVAHQKRRPGYWSRR